ncbi:helix-turn-helix domain-containing protein [Streptomyces werraensis]|uniref:helix-turn-helix domain-containing protein n=2 Tax=Streptomyces TaxID=1883 RepID=UPI003434E019
MTAARPVALGGGTGRVSRTFGIRPEQSQSTLPRSGSGQPQGAILPVEPQSHPDETRADIDSSRGRKSVEPVLVDTAEVAAMLNMSTSWVYREASKLGLKGYKLGRGRNAKVLYTRAEISKWLERQKIHEKRIAVCARHTRSGTPPATPPHVWHVHDPRLVTAQRGPAAALPGAAGRACTDGDGRPGSRHRNRRRCARPG